MELETNKEEDQPIPPSNNHLKPKLEVELEDDFPMEICSSKGVFQDLHQLDNFTLPGSSLNPDYGIHAAGYDPFGPLSYGSSSDDLDLYEFKPFEPENGANGSGMMQNFQGGSGGYLTNLNKGFVGGCELDFSTHLVHLDCPPLDPKLVSFFVPDEGSCVTADNGMKKTNSNTNTSASTRKAGKGKKKTNSSKGQWTTEEDRVLKHLVEKFGVRKWSYIAQMLKGRIGKQCRERWHNHLRPDIKKDFWTEEEDRILITAHAEVGNKWSEIAKKLPGRTENSIKNHWNATKRRQYTRRKCRSKWPRPSPILQNYIRSLNLPRGKSSSVNNNNNNPENPLAIVKPPSTWSPDIDRFCSSEDRLVPDFDLDRVPEFVLDEKLLEGDTIESLLGDIPLLDCNGGEERSSIGNQFRIQCSSSSSSSSSSLATMLQCGVKKELDLMEMISQVNL